MSLFRWSRGWDPLRDLRQEVGHFLDQTFGPTGLSRPFRSQNPALNAFDRTDEFVVTAELPGVKQEDLDLTVTGDALTLRAERELAEGVKDEQYRRQERPVGAWERRVVLPDEVEPDKAHADLHNGILTVRIPKAEKTKPKQIPISVSVN